MSDIMKYITNFPTWIAAPVILITLFVTLWPKILLVSSDLNAANRMYQDEKRRLELLKLCYEIEAIKKANSLEGLEKQLPPAALEPRPQAKSRPSVWHRFTFGALGAMIPSFYNGTKSLTSFTESGVSPQISILE